MSLHQAASVGAISAVNDPDHIQDAPVKTMLAGMYTKRVALCDGIRKWRITRRRLTARASWLNLPSWGWLYT